MVASKMSKVCYFGLFLLPALLLYTCFFIIPLIQGVQYSFTDWNGIVPEIPFIMNRGEFNRKVLEKVRRPDDRKLLQQFYKLNPEGEVYLLQNWVAGPGGHRQITPGEKKRIKRILKQVGISAIKFVGWANYREMFQTDERFMPRIQKTFLFNQFEDLPETIDVRTFRKQLLSHLQRRQDRRLVLTHYQLNRHRTAYLLKPPRNRFLTEQLKQVLANHFYRKSLVWGVLGFTLFFTVFNVCFANLIAMFLALVLDLKLKARNCLRAIFFLPNVLSLVIVAFIWSFVFRLVLPALTGISSWFEPELAPYSVVIVSVWQSCGYLMVIYLAGLQAIPADILEAAQIDGARSWQRLRYVILPLLLPALTICLFYSLANSLKTFEVAMALTNGGPAYVTTPIVLDIYNNAFLQNRFGYGTAKAVFLCLIIMALTGIQLTVMKRREVEL